MIKPQIEIRPVTENDIPQLAELSYKTFHDAFYHLNAPEDVQRYMDDTFSEDNLLREFSHPHSQFYFAVSDEQVVGYVKLNFGHGQTEFQEADGFEIQRLYILAGHQGKSIGEQLINFSIGQAQERHCRYIWLGVWEHNLNAVRFYQRMGFAVFGQHDFLLGKDLQTDLLMKRPLRESEAENK